MGAVKTNKIQNKDRAGQTLFAVTGKPILFDKDGIAHDVADEDMIELVSVPGYQEIA